MGHIRIERASVGATEIIEAHKNDTAGCPNRSNDAGPAGSLSGGGSYFLSEAYRGGGTILMYGLGDSQPSG